MVALLYPLMVLILVEIVARISGWAALEWLTDPASRESVRFGYLWLLFLGGFLYALTNRLPWSSVAGALVVMLAAAVHAGKMLILQQPLLPGDVLLVGLVIEIWSSAYFPFSASQVMMFALMVGLVMALGRWGLPDKRLSGRVRLAAVLVTLPALYYYTTFVSAAASRNVPMDQKLTVVWDARHNEEARHPGKLGIQNPDYSVAFNYGSFGFIAGFLQNLHPAKGGEAPPEGYAAEQVARIWERYAAESRDDAAGTSLPPDEQPHVVVVLSESFWDPLWLDGVTITPDPLPSFRRITGGPDALAFQAVSPIFGGYTCKAEFELLSGMAMGLLPQQLVPHRKAFGEQVTTLPAVFKRHGYTTRAIHPFLPEFWNRNLIYPRIGFDSFTHIGTMKHRDVRGKFISDDALAEEIISTIESATGPAFVFAITMQNHSPYGDHRYGEVEPENVAVNKGTIDVNALRDYVHGIRDADAMLDKLTRRLANESRPVLLLFMGDHQPSLVPADAMPGDFVQQIKPGYVPPALAVKARYFNTALFWSNRGDVPALPGPAVSMAALPSLILQHVKLPLPPFMDYSRRVFAGYPVVHNGWGLQADGNTTLFINGNTGNPLLEDFRIISHDVLLGKNFSAEAMASAMKEMP